MLDHTSRQDSEARRLPSQKRKGASAKKQLQRLKETTPMEDLDDFPMVVWLRGDEDYLEDFSLDADQVMAQLGIRRSRLTQISGKELRVARIRDGRYIKPLYRPQDVDSYLAWTRPTRSHSKATNLVKEAASELTDVALDLAGIYQKAGRDLADQITQGFSRIMGQSERVQWGRFFKVASAIQFRLERLEKNESNGREGFQATLSTLAEGFSGLEARLRQEAQALPQIWQKLEKSLLQVKDTLSSQGQNLNDLREKLEKVASQQDEQIRKLQDRLQEIADEVCCPEEIPPRIRPRLKRIPSQKTATQTAVPTVLPARYARLRRPGRAAR